MKATLFTMCLFGWIAGYSQTCSVTVTGPSQVCPGVPVTFTGVGEVTQSNQSFNFNNNLLPAGWSTSGTASYGVLCGNSLDNTPYFWASTSTGTPQITTDIFDVCSGGTIDFEMKYAIQGGAVPCEGPDEQDEGVSIQYSTDGGVTWIEFVYFSPWGFQLPANPGGNASINGPTAYTNWSNFSIPIPAAAATTNTMFRWIQVNSSGGCCDNWGLDNIFINAGPCLTTNIGWDIPGSNTPSSNTTTIPIYSDTVIVAGLYDDNGNLLCQSDPFPVTVFIPFINGGPDQSICEGQSVTLAASSGTNFVWDNGVTNNVPFAPATTQTYTVNGIDLNGCAATDQVLVTVNPSNVYTVSYPNPEYCIDAADPTPTLSTPVAGSYSVAPATVTIHAATGVLDLSTSTTTTSQLYTITFTPTAPCYQPVTTQLTINALPVVNAGNDTTICDGSPVLIQATGTASSYAWDNGILANGTNVTPTSTTTYTVTGTSAAGCVNTDSRVVTVNPLPTATIAGSTTVCMNAAQPTVTFTGSSGTAPYTFSYSYNGGPAIQLVSNPAGVATISVPTTAAGSNQYSLISVQDASSTACQNPQQGVVTVNVSALPTASIAGDITICQFSNQPQVTFTGGNTSGPYTFTYVLNNGAQQTITTSGNLNTATINVPTTVVGNFVYQLTGVQDGASPVCASNPVDSAVISINPLPNATIAGDTSLCLNENMPVVTFQASNGVSPFIFTYSLNGGTSQTISSPTGTATISAPTNVPGIYSYELISVQESSVSTCSNAIGNTIEVEVWDLPNVSAGPDFSVCDGFSTTLFGQGAVSYIWNNNGIDGVAFVPQTSLDYIVEGTDQNGCKNTDTVHVTVVPIPQIDFAADITAGCSPLVTRLTNESTGNLTNCQWTLSDGSVYNGCGSVDVTLTNPGCYDVTLTVSTPEGCTNTGTEPAFLCVYPNPIADFDINPAEVEISNTFVNFFNHSYGAVNYQWDFSDGGTSLLENPTHVFPDQEAAYYDVYLIAISSDGCRDTVSKTVHVGEDLIYYVPNAFSPDGDEFNNVFQPVLTAGFDTRSYHLQIFNRWGELIFESLDYEQGWDGTYHGEVLLDGTYIWKIKVKSKASDKKTELKGHVTLLK
ncbi:PKD domain-containing protein [Fluviicola sp.]|uniref:PKD domain-containing protein n=1 Tax=Fluviicola sp. TaxID=1917219 RepID=UPI0031E1FA19